MSAQGHALTKVEPRWRNPVRWREVYGNFSALAPDVPPLWGTVKDSIDNLLAVGIQPLGSRPIKAVNRPLVGTLTAQCCLPV